MRLVLLAFCTSWLKTTLATTKAIARTAIRKPRSSMSEQAVDDHHSLPRGTSEQLPKGTRSANSSELQRATTSKGTPFLVLRSPESPQIPCNNKGCNCFLSSRSCVRITQVALLTARGEQLIHFALTCDGWIEHSPF